MRTPALVIVCALLLSGFTTHRGNSKCNDILPGTWTGKYTTDDEKTFSWEVTYLDNGGFTGTFYDHSGTITAKQTGTWVCTSGDTFKTTVYINEENTPVVWLYRIINYEHRRMIYQNYSDQNLGPVFTSTKITSR